MITPATVVSLLVGAVFGIGLAISGMTLPTKVIGFLDVFGDWDPALAFVMGGAVLVYGAAFFTIRHRTRAVFADAFQLPSTKDIDAKLLGGAALFGIGWGLAGFCPGPALTSIATGLTGVFVFVLAMLTGMFAWRIISDRFDLA